MTAVRPYLTTEQIWRRYDAVESRLTAPVSERMLALAGLRAGMRVLDLATGRGEPALRAAHCVGPQGMVVGVEPSAASLQMAKEKAEGEGLTNLELREVDAESFEGASLPGFHAVTVRWGLMYMASPVAALVNSRRALLPTGVFVAALWAEPERVPYFTLPRHLLERYRPIPTIDPEAPGTFRHADLGRFVRDLNQAGLSLVHVEETEVPAFEAATGAEMVEWVRAFGLTRLLNDLPENAQQAWEQEFIVELERRRTGALLQLGGVTRIVVARPTAGAVQTAGSRGG